MGTYGVSMAKSFKINVVSRYIDTDIDDIDTDIDRH